MAGDGFGGLLNLVGTVLPAQTDSSFWLPPPDSTTAGSVDWLFYFILYICAFFFGLIVVLMVTFTVLYRRRHGSEPTGKAKHNTALEIVWSVIPLGIVIFIFYQGFTGYMDMRTAPREAYEINVTARKWSWSFRYANGHVDPELHVPVGRPVKLILNSEDVIHSLWIPDFRVKMDCVPGRYNKTWFQAKQPGTHHLYCAEYCGTGHSSMMTLVKVHRPGEFETWLDDAARYAANLSPAERGERAYIRFGCVGCHTMDGTAKTGPSFKGIFGQEHRFTNAAPTVVDENYIRESILNPSAKVREGYTDQMNSYKKSLDDGTLTEEDISDLIEYIKSLK